MKLSELNIQDVAFKALDSFKIEIPSWGFANTGTRFGKFVQAAAATTIEEKFADAAEVNRLTGVTPTVALHVLWDLPGGLKDVSEVKGLERRFGVRSGSINPNLFQDQEYKFGSLCNPSAEIRGRALDHMLDSIEIAKALGSRDISLWMADGSNYPGTQSIRKRIGWLEQALRTSHDHLAENQRLLVEYKPFEPAFYHTDIADWGMSSHFAKVAGPKACVLVDTGHHYSAQNIEQIVAWLLHTEMLGGFHFNDRRYADDDLTLGSIDPYQIFRIFHEIHAATDDGLKIDIAYMIDQSHNLKGKMEAMVQTVMTAQELYLKAALVNRGQLAGLQQNCELVAAEELYRGAFWRDVRPLTQAWREAHGLPADPLAALRASGYVERAARERGSRSMAVSSYA
ncbi:Xylose isomerase domain-containing protein TIM barrel [Candidatus Sulfotelmatomonas gaucii]|uniref:Xylose isomerase domain-containing protein TIM barrel n=1 Tax=Candidatus Sulfuritelmatomonas gaucii TaxID=2043161 RepID=A0A2N9L8T7_9BACT|nr:Xylose isomerase domain-containing protein TIM barrel [Candidatus Sulfotelmatomonas gaucii]